MNIFIFDIDSNIEYLIIISKQFSNRWRYYIYDKINVLIFTNK
jgi:hypothetical protein